MTVENYLKFKNLDLGPDEKRFFGELCSHVSGYLRYPRVYVKEGSSRVRDWPEKLLDEMILFVKVYKVRRLQKKVVVVRRKNGNSANHIA